MIPPLHCKRSEFAPLAPPASISDNAEERRAWSSLWPQPNYCTKGQHPEICGAHEDLARLQCKGTLPGFALFVSLRCPRVVFLIFDCGRRLRQGLRASAVPLSPPGWSRRAPQRHEGRRGPAAVASASRRTGEKTRWCIRGSLFKNSTCFQSPLGTSYSRRSASSQPRRGVLRKPRAQPWGNGQHDPNKPRRGALAAGFVGSAPLRGFRGDMPSGSQGCALGFPSAPLRGWTSSAGSLSPRDHCLRLVIAVAI